MDFGQLYMASPDWIKGLMVILPFLTLYGLARLYAPRPPAAAPRAPMPVPREGTSELAEIRRLHLAPIEALEVLEGPDEPEAAEGSRMPARKLELER